MAIERKNSFHLLLSDDEFKLLRLLAERDGLNASDYLRSMLRRMAGAPSHLAAALSLQQVLGSKVDLMQSAKAATVAAKATKKKAVRKKR